MRNPTARHSLLASLALLTLSITFSSIAKMRQIAKRHSQQGGGAQLFLQDETPSFQMPLAATKNKKEATTTTTRSRSRSAMSRNYRVEDDPIRALQKLTNSPAPGTLICPSPLVPIYDKIVTNTTTTATTLNQNTKNSSRTNNNRTLLLQERNIPRTIHVSMKSRCLPPDLADSVVKWQTGLPQHSLFFHDDEAVDRFIYQHHWPEFPHLHEVMKCVRYTGAMKIDIWRILIIYRFGGIYTDIDNWPGPQLSEDTPILPTDDLFSGSDAASRPSQSFFAAIPQHPALYFTMQEILRRVLALPQIQKPKVVFTTGPDAMRHGFAQHLSLLPKKNKKKKNLVVVVEPDIEDGFFLGKFGKTVHKIRLGESHQYFQGSLGGTFDDLVVWNATLNVTRRQRVEQQSGVEHWTKVIYRRNKYRDKNKTANDDDNFRGSCMDYLYRLHHHPNNETMSTGTAPR